MSSQRIAVIDYGMGNLHSAASALQHVCSAEVIITSDKAVIESADRVVFPGVGAIRDCMHEIQKLGFDELIKQQVKDKPVLAICVGMQALMKHSEENEGVDCIGLVDGDVKFFGNDLHDQANHSHGHSAEVLDDRLKVPHMGWNQVHQTMDHPLWSNIEQDARFYFVHSYYVSMNKPELISGTTHYGLDIVSTIADTNLFCVQFHPEKSHSDGLQLLRNFSAWDGQK